MTARDLTVLDLLVSLSCRFFERVSLERVDVGARVELRAALGRLDDGQCVAVLCDGPDESAVAAKLQTLFADTLACIDGVGNVLEGQPEAARDQALVIARLLERGSLVFRIVRGSMVVQSPNMRGVPGPVMMVRQDDQDTLAVLHSLETWLQVRWPADLTS